MGSLEQGLSGARRRIDLFLYSACFGNWNRFHHFAILFFFGLWITPALTQLGGSRFVRFNNEQNVYEELSEVAARDKIGHALRFCARKNNANQGPFRAALHVFLAVP